MIRSVAVAVVMVAGALTALPNAAQAKIYVCSPGDRPETSVQGYVPPGDQLSGRSQQGYWCNVRPVGHNDIGGRGGDWQLTWYGRCAYRSTPTDNGDAVAVLDVANPRRPRVTKILHEPQWQGRGGTLGIHEGLHASVQRGVLVVPVGTLISVYDLKPDCTRPRLRANFDIGYSGQPFKDPNTFPPNMNIHSGKLTRAGDFYYATDLGNGLISPTGPCITVVDLRDLAHPKLAGKFGEDFPCHDLELNDDGTRAYVGYYASGPGYEAAIAGAFTPVVQPSHAITGLRVLDTSEVQARRPNPQVRVLSELTGGRQHTETFTHIKGRDYIIGGEEAVCPGGNGRIIDITDEAHPVQVAELPLEINQPENCPGAAVYLERRSAMYLLGYMTHYISVDDPADASLAFVSWYNSGLRIFDIRDPRHPREIAYFNPPVGKGAPVTHDTSMTYSRYDARTGQVWTGSLVGGFHVIELTPRLRPTRAGLKVSAKWSVGPTTETLKATGAARVAWPPHPGELSASMYCVLG